jgi:hypothetical protein
MVCLSKTLLNRKTNNAIQNCFGIGDKAHKWAQASVKTRQPTAQNTKALVHFLRKLEGHTQQIHFIQTRFDSIIDYLVEGITPYIPLHHTGRHTKTHKTRQGKGNNLITNAQTCAPGNVPMPRSKSMSIPTTLPPHVIKQRTKTRQNKHAGFRVQGIL